MQIAVTGDIAIRDKHKITGFIDAFSSIQSTHHFAPPLRNHISNKYIDVLFGESGDFFDIPYTNITNVFLWSVFDIEQLAAKNPQTNFYLCSKSILHDNDVIEEYLTKGFDPEYQRYGLEGINVIEFRKKIAKSKKINEHLYQLTDNLFYMYIPCSLAQSNIRRSVNKDVDVTYFGTLNNRPNVVKILNVLEHRGFKVTYNRNGFISPEECIGYYNRSIVTLHEQVGPVHLEYPVRLGESSMCNSKVFALNPIEQMKTFAKNHSTVPDHESFNNTDEMINAIESYITKYKNTNTGFVHDKPNTYKHYTNMMVDLCK